MLLPTLLLAMALSTQGFDDWEFDHAFRKDGEGLREYGDIDSLMRRIGLAMGEEAEQGEEEEPLATKELMRRLGEPEDQMAMESQVSAVATGDLYPF